MAQLVEFAGNHVWLVSGLIASVLAVAFYELRLRGSATTNVSAADAVRLINKGALVLDLRGTEDFAAGHIVNARNVPLERIAQGEEIHKQKSKILIAVCATGMSSGRAAGLLRKAGYENAFSLKGGIAGWRADNLPLVK
jgi:rhodanese-related sulfurtransferase